MGESIGSIFKSFKGPDAQPIQAMDVGGGGGYAPTARTGAMDLNANPEAASIMPANAKAPQQSDDALKRLSNQLAFANSVASTGRGLYSDLSRGGPGGSPLAAPARGPAGPYQPTTQRGGSLRLSDILGRR